MSQIYYNLGPLRRKLELNYNSMLHFSETSGKEIPRTTTINVFKGSTVKRWNSPELIQKLCSILKVDIESIMICVDDIDCSNCIYLKNEICCNSELIERNRKLPEEEQVVYTKKNCRAWDWDKKQ